MYKMYDYKMIIYHIVQLYHNKMTLGHDKRKGSPYVNALCRAEDSKASCPKFGGIFIFIMNAFFL